MLTVWVSMLSVVGCASRGAVEPGSVIADSSQTKPRQVSAKLASTRIPAKLTSTGNHGEEASPDGIPLTPPPPSWAIDPEIRVEENQPETIQETENATEESSRSVETPQPTSGRVVDERFAKPIRPITEGELIQLALQHSPVLRPLGIRIIENPESATTVYDSAITSSDPFFGPQAALAEFDSVLSAGITSQNNDRVFNNATLGGDVQELVQDFTTATAGLRKRSQYGTTFEFSSDHQYDNNNRSGNRFSNYWETQMLAGVRQPLLRGAGREFNLIAGPNAQPGFNFSNGIWIARLNDKISEADFEIAVRSFVRDLYSVYWDLKRQYRNYESLLEARDLAYRTWQSVLARSDARLEGGEASKEAQARAKYYRYCRESEIALGGGPGESGLLNIERTMRRLAGIPAEDGMLLYPTDPDPDAAFTFDTDRLIARAMSRRTELSRQSIKVQQQRLKLVAAKNFLLPQMDLVGRYRLRGFGDDLTGSGERFRSAYQDFFSLDHQEWEFGVEMGVVAGRRQAKAAVRNAKLQLIKEQSILREQQRTIEFQILETISEVRSAYESMRYSRLQAEAARDRLDASEVLFDHDKILIEFLLNAQEELLLADQNLARDRARYSLALVSVGAESGSLLSDVGIIIHRDCSQSHIHYPSTHYQNSRSLTESGLTESGLRQ